MKHIGRILLHQKFKYLTLKIGKTTLKPKILNKNKGIYHEYEGVLTHVDVYPHVLLPVSVSMKIAALGVSERFALNLPQPLKTLKGIHQQIYPPKVHRHITIKENQLELQDSELEMWKNMVYNKKKNNMLAPKHVPSPYSAKAYLAHKSKPTIR